MSALVLAALSGLAWGASDFVAGLAARRVRVLAVLLVSQVVGLALATAVVAVRGEPLPGLRELAFAALSSLAGVGGLAAFYRGLAVGAMSVVAPLSAGGAVIPILVGLLAGERPQALQLVGVALVTGGAMLASIERAHGVRSVRLARGVPYALAAAVGFGMFFVFVDQAAAASAEWTLVGNRFTGVIVLAFVAAIVRPPLPSGTGLLPLVVVGVLDTSANLLFAFASRLGLLSLGAALGSLYPVVVVVLARVFLGERLARVQALGVGAALAGVALVSAGK